MEGATAIGLDNCLEDEVRTALHQFVVQALEIGRGI